MRSAIALHPRLFGRGRAYLIEAAGRHAPSVALRDDLGLFATTFLGGFLFMAIYLA